MDNYNYSPNGIDYDPDLLYPQEQPRQGRRDNSGGRDSGARSGGSPDGRKPSGRSRRRRDDYDPIAAREDEYRRERSRKKEEADSRLERARLKEEAARRRHEELVAEQAAERKVRSAERAAERAAEKARRQEAKAASRADRKPITESGFIRFFTDKRTHAFFGVLLICVAIYLLIAAISFMRAGAVDQSAVRSLTLPEVASGAAKVDNAGGPMGAFVAQYVFAQGLGLGSLAAIIYLVILGLGLMGIKKCNFWSVTFKSLLVAVAVSIVAGLVGLWMGSSTLLGGVHGQMINEFLVKNVEWIGAALVSLVLIAAVVFVYLNDIIGVYNKYKAIQKARRERHEQMILEREEAQRKVREAMQESSFDSKEDETTPDAVDDGAENPTYHPSTVSMGFEEDNAVTDEYAIPDEERQVAAVEGMTATCDNPDEESMPGIEQKAAEGKVPSEGPAFEVVANSIEVADPSHVGADTLYDPTAELSHYKRPGLELLNITQRSEENYDIREQEANKERIIKALGQFDIEIAKIDATVGPTVTLYEIVPVEGTRIAKIKRLEDDIAMTLSAKGIRIIAPIPGKGTIGIEVPNHDPQAVSIHSILSSRAYQESKAQLPMAMGATISNEVYIADLADMPHLLVAGATGQGKSVGLNTILASLIYKKHPAELKFVLIDPKRVEFSLYNALERHFLAKLPDEEEAIVTNMENALRTLNSLCVEMERRYDLLKDAHVVKITKYNELFVQKKLNPEKGHRYLPYIVIVVDEFSDFIMVAGKQIETPIARIAQMARAVGMHLIIATQRPTTNVITGLIKANFPGRIAFKVTSSVDSKTILDRPGANNLIGKGDMLFSHNGVIDRVQCAYIDTKEVQRICNFIDQQAGFEHSYFLPEPMMEDEGTSFGTTNVSERDPLFEEAAQIIVQTGVASTSSLQRRYSIGYNRAGKIMDQLEAAGIVGPATGGKARSVLIDAMQLGSFLNSRNSAD